MSKTIECARCAKTTEALDEAPLPGKWGEELMSHCCAACFGDWMSTEIMIINEYRLDLSLPSNQDQLNKEMAKFLSLPSAPEGEAAGPPPDFEPPAS